MVLTNEGIDHLVERDNGQTPEEPFDGLVVTRGNDDPAETDTVEDLTQVSSILMKLDSGYPVKGDTDPRNTGRDPDFYTWRFTQSAGTPFVGSNIAIVNHNGGALSGPVCVHEKLTDALAQRYDERLVVWVNAKAGEDVVVSTATEQSLENRVQRVDSFTARTRALHSWPSGSVVDSCEVRSRPQPGQAVWTAARVVGRDGGLLRTSDVERFTLSVDEFRASTSQWEQVRSEEIDCVGHVFGVEQLNDQRWTSPGGYNASHLWFPLPGEKEGTFRLRYDMRLTDDDVRRWVNVVEVR